MATVDFVATLALVQAVQACEVFVKVLEREDLLALGAVNRRLAHTTRETIESCVPFCIDR
jgi:hypothetical protein